MGRAENYEAYSGLSWHARKWKRDLAELEALSETARKLAEVMRQGDIYLALPLSDLAEENGMTHLAKHLRRWAKRKIKQCTRGRSKKDA